MNCSPCNKQTTFSFITQLNTLTFLTRDNHHRDQMASDHAPTICSSSEFFLHAPNIRFDYSKANWCKYRQLIAASTKDLPIPSNSAQIDSAVESFTKILLDAQRSCIPTHSFDNKPQIAIFTKQMIQFKNTLNRQMQRSLDANEKRSMKTTINKLQKKINELIIAEHNNFWDNNLKKYQKVAKNSGN